MEHLLQCLCLWRGTWEAVEDDSFVVFAETVVNVGKDVYHQLIRYELSVVNIALCGLSECCFILDFTAQYVARRDVSEAILRYHLVALCAFSCTGSTENYDILHCFFVYIMMFLFVIMGR